MTKSIIQNHALVSSQETGRFPSFQITKPQLDTLRELVLGGLQALNEIPSWEKADYNEEYVELRQLAERLGAKLGRLPKQLRASAKRAAEDLAADKAHTADLKRAFEKSRKKQR